MNKTIENFNNTKSQLDLTVIYRVVHKTHIEYTFIFFLVHIKLSHQERSIQMIVSLAPKLMLLTTSQLRAAVLMCHMKFHSFSTFPRSVSPLILNNKD